MDIIKAAIEKMDKVIANWYVSDPILLNTYCMVEKLPDPKQETIGIDSRSLPPQIRFNPNFINAIPYEMLEMVMASESFKLLLRHATNRLQHPREVCGMASTLAVDNIIVKNNQNIPGVKETFPMPKDFNLPENSYMEDYYRRLKEDIDDMMQNVETMFGQSDPDQPGEQESDGGSGNGDGEGEPKDGEGSGYKEFDGPQDALKKYLDPRSTSNQHWAQNDMLDAQVENMVNCFKGSSKMWGKFSGDALSQIVAANTPKISAREILRRFNTSVTTTMQFLTRMKPNRRFDMEAQGRRRKYTTKILFAMDSSGSMSDEDIAEGCAVVNSVCKRAKVDYCFWDVEIKMVEKNFKKSKKEFRVPGRGGTDPQKVFQYVDENHYDGLILFTDCGFDGDVRPPRKTKVLVLGTEKSSKNPLPFGYFATLDRNA